MADIYRYKWEISIVHSLTGGTYNENIWDHIADYDVRHRRGEV